LITPSEVPENTISPEEANTEIGPLCCSPLIISARGIAVSLLHEKTFPS